jgi:hypothetical protein
MNMKSIILWNITPCSPVEFPDSSEERIVSIFRVKENS